MASPSKESHKAHGENRVLERLVNLTFALLSAARDGKPYVTASWISEHVSGYAKTQSDSFKKMLQRDYAMLREAGVPVVRISNAEGTLSGYALNEEEYELPDIDFTFEEASVLALAGMRTASSELGISAKNAWTKLVSGGALREIDTPLQCMHHDDLDAIGTPCFDAIESALRCHHRITFRYGEGSLRTMDPWSLIVYHGRYYLTGFDLDREAQRTFRLHNISCVKQLADTPITHQPPRPERIISSVRDYFSHPAQSDLISASITLSAPLREWNLPIGKHELVSVDPQELINCALAHPDTLIVHSPENIRALLRDAFRTVVDTHV